ncbi:unnamed protein product [Ectocarpus sp. 12 AP-2014]
MSASQEESQGMTTAAEESQDTPGDSLDNTQELKEEEEEGGGGKKKGKKKKAELPIFTKRDPIDRVPLPSTGTTFTVLSWNVNGIRATVKKGLEPLRRMVEKEMPDIICLQETKIQEKDVEALRAQDILPGYASEWSCSRTKLGYSGTAVFFTKQSDPWNGDGGGIDATGNGLPSDEPARKKLKQGKISTFFSPKPSKKSAKGSAPESETPTRAPAAEPATSAAASTNSADSLPGGRSGFKVLSVRFGIGSDSKHNNEGRSITVEYEKLFVVTVYVPNSGEKLVRLDYRTKEWDVALKAYVESLEAQGKPVVLNGDLNVAHLDLDIYNRGAKHLPKNAATTKEERDSFDSWVNRGKVSDAFRRLHPDAEGAYTYWSVRTGARPVNRGLRLDYFVCSNAVFEEGAAEGGQAKATARRAKGSAPKGKGATGAKGMVVHDCFMLDEATVGVSDHCPIGITLRST